MNIYQKMLKATEQINKVAKGIKVGFGQNGYKAVGEASVLEAVKPVEIELGIYSYPLSRKVIETNAFTTTNEQGKEKTSVFLRLETVYRFVNTEKPDEYIDITTYGDGVDTQDKAPGKAMTYSDKYALLKAYKIETGEDPDQNASGDMNKKPPNTPPKETPKGNKPTPPKEDKTTPDINNEEEPTPPGPPTEEQLKKLEELNTKIEDIAIYYKCKVEELTEDHARLIIDKKERQKEKAKEAKKDEQQQ